MPSVHVRITDATTNQPLAVRLRVTDGAGRDCVPFGRPAVFRTGPGEDIGGQVQIDGQNWYYVDGGAEMVIPPGAVRIEARRGFEYLPLDTTTELKPGQLAVRVQIKRWTDERERGWYSGDVAAFEIDPFAALLEGAAEDLAVVNVLARELDAGPATRVPNLTAFSGATTALARPGHLVAVGTLNAHPHLGALALLGCHRPVFPLRSGVLNGWLDWSLIDWCEQTHRRKDGLALWLMEEPSLPDGEAVVAALLGKLDAVAIRTVSDLGIWYALLDCGVRLPLVGGSHKASNTAALGSGYRTYANVPPAAPFDYLAWLQSVRAGRTFITQGPLVSLAVAGLAHGGGIDITGGALLLVEAESRWPGVPHALEVVHNGEVVARSHGATVRLSENVVVRQRGWLAARCQVGPALVAHTTPVYFESKDPPPALPTGTRDFLRERMSATRQWATTVHGEERFRAPLLANLDAAERRLTAT